METILTLKEAQFNNIVYALLKDYQQQQQVVIDLHNGFYNNNLQGNVTLVKRQVNKALQSIKRLEYRLLRCIKYYNEVGEKWKPSIIELIYNNLKDCEKELLRFGINITQVFL